MKRGTLLLASALALAACAPQAALTPTTELEVNVSTVPSTTEPDPTTTTSTTPQRPMYEGFDAELSETASLVAAIGEETKVYDAPNGSEVMTIEAQTILGTSTVLMVVGKSDGWYEVMLPIRPNGSTGWLDPEDVEIYVVEGRITIDLSDRHLSYVVNGEEVLSSTVAVGRDAYPTPTGTFFVTDSVRLANPNSPWGSHALGLSARSDTITEFNGGDGIIGIHGTNTPSSIGKAASLGCVRLPNELITALYENVPIGTPVEIRA